ncbi:MAG: acetyl-CoA carboxylase biotin carboxyl carrier protein [Simkaniaceae bacterium]
MDLEEIKKLIEALEKSHLKKIIVKSKDGGEVHLEKESEYHARASEAYIPPPPPAAEGRKTHFEHPAATPHETQKEAEGGTFISSPLVGTFYESPSPEDPPFVKAGDQVDENTVVCIVEAMKVMNEVKAGIKGTIKEVLVDNAQPVEFGTKLFLVE